MIIIHEDCGTLINQSMRHLIANILFWLLSVLAFGSTLKGGWGSGGSLSHRAITWCNSPMACPDYLCTIVTRHGTRHFCQVGSPWCVSQEEFRAAGWCALNSMASLLFPGFQRCYNMAVYRCYLVTIGSCPSQKLQIGEKLQYGEMKTCSIRLCLDITHYPWQWYHLGYVCPLQPRKILTIPMESPSSTALELKKMQLMAQMRGHLFVDIKYLIQISWDFSPRGALIQTVPLAIMQAYTRSFWDMALYSGKQDKCAQICITFPIMNQFCFYVLWLDFGCLTLMQLDQLKGYKVSTQTKHVTGISLLTPQ